MTEEERKQLTTIGERSIILLLIIVIAVIMVWSSKQVKVRREAHLKAGGEERQNEPVSVGGNNADFYFKEGLRLPRAGRFDEAIAALDKTIELNPAHYSAISNLGLVYKNMFLESKNPDFMNKAIECYDKAISVNPNFADVHNNLGDAYFNQGKYAEAEKEFKECTRLDPLNVNAYNNLGVALILQDKKEEAVNYWEESLKINPDQPKTRDYIQRNK